MKLCGRLQIIQRKVWLGGWKYPHIRFQRDLRDVGLCLGQLKHIQGLRKHGVQVIVHTMHALYSGC